MSNAGPIEQNNRSAIVDIVRGFALVGVLMANFTGYSSGNLPSNVFNEISGPIDQALNKVNTIFFEWKFMTIFSILFGYGFGMIIAGVERKGINPIPFFLRRMFWLLIFGVIHTLFWWGDVLNFYCISGALLLLFRKMSSKAILICSLLFMFILPALISFLLRNEPSYFTDEHLQMLYEDYKYGNIIEVFNANLDFSYSAFIKSGVDVHDIIETLGRFLFGYFLLRVKLFDEVEKKQKLFKKLIFIFAPIMIGYLTLRYYSIKNEFSLAGIYGEAVIKIGILATSIVYVSSLVLIYIGNSRLKMFSALQALGKMTLTNYLLISAFCVTLHYGIGFGQLDIIQMRWVWMCAGAWLMIEIAFSKYWLKQFRYGPMEWIWRQLTYQKKIPLRKKMTDVAA